jgi:glycosyltransferase involved in cell wall biosynthesis
LVVGQGLFGEEETLLRMAEQRKVRDRIVYAGWVPEPDLPAHFALANAAIYPFDDTLINRSKCAVKLLDLLVAGVPVIADAVGQNGEYIQNGVSGLLVNPGDTVAFVAATARVVADRALGNQLGRKAQQRMCTEYSWDRLAEQLEHVYRAHPGLKS